MTITVSQWLGFRSKTLSWHGKCVGGLFFEKKIGGGGGGRVEPRDFSDPLGPPGAKLNSGKPWQPTTYNSAWPSLTASGLRPWPSDQSLAPWSPSFYKSLEHSYLLTSLRTIIVIFSWW